jgi:hypothetical protein
MGVDLIGVMSRGNDPASWMDNFASQVVPTMSELGRQPPRGMS